MQQFDLKNVLDGQINFQQTIRELPPAGIIEYYQGAKFKVTSGVFIPHNDSKPLIDSMVINVDDSVLDVFCGAGPIGIIAAIRGAGRVVALDSSEDAVQCARENAVLNEVADVFSAFESDVYSAIADSDEQFDVVAGNPPFLDYSIPNMDAVECSFWDVNLRTNRLFLEGLNRRLKPNGRAYISQANFGDWKKVVKLAREFGFNTRIADSYIFEHNSSIEFLALELTRL